MRQAMDYKELLENRRSIRKFQEKNVPLEILKDLIKESTLAPSAGNEQPWKYIIVNSREMLDRMSHESKRSLLERIEGNPNDYAWKYEKLLRNESFDIFYHAPALVMILGESHLKNLCADSSLAASYLMMGATARGLGSCWINFATEIRDQAMRSELAIPDNCTIVAPIILGYPEKVPAIPSRREPEVLKIIS